MCFVGCLMAALAVLLSSTVALAVEDGSLTLVMRHESDDRTTYVGGTTATAYLVADLDEAVNSYTLRDEFAALDVTFNDGMDAKAMGEAAAKAANIVSAKRIEGISATSGTDGMVSFGRLPNGVYLVLQTGSKDEAEHYTELTPFLISVPEVIEDDVVFNVTAYPKIAPVPPTPDGGRKQDDKVAPDGKPTSSDTSKPVTNPTASNMPRTGDPFDPWLWAACLLTGSVMVTIGKAGLHRLRQRKARQG